MLDILKKLIDTVSVSGSESAISEVISGLIDGCADEITTDALGSLIAVKKSANQNAKKIMLAAHMDEIGFIVTFIEDSGWLRVSQIGGINWAAASSSEVLFGSGMSGLLIPEGKVSPNDYAGDKFFIDIGAENRADAENKVKIGDVCTVAPKIVKLLNNRVAASKLDDKIACAVLIKVLRDFKGLTPDHDLYFVFTAQEELGVRGARTAAQYIMPDYSIAVDVTGTGDTPECTPMAIKLGGGAAIKLMDGSVICAKEMVNLLMKTAVENNIKYQSEILVRGGTDASAMQAAGAGSIAGAVSIPARYIHTGVEMCDMGDVDACAGLLAAVLKKFNIY